MERLTVRIAVFVFLIVLSALSAYAGECLQSDQEMFDDLKINYSAMLSGGYHHGGWSPTQCWEGDDKVLNGKLRSLAIEIISDDRLQLADKYESVSILNMLKSFGDDDAILKKIKDVLYYVVVNAEDQWPNALTILKKHFDAYDAFIEFYNEPKNSVNRMQAIHIVSDYFVSDTRYKSFLENNMKHIRNEYTFKLIWPKFRVVTKQTNEYYYNYIKDNNMMDMLGHIMSVEKDIGLILYLIEKTEYSSVGLSEINKDDYNDYFKFSKGIFELLQRRLDMVFPRVLLKRMRPQELRLLRNGIFAFHGRNFKSKNLQFYYYGDSENIKKFCKGLVCGSSSNRNNQFKESMLTETDRVNIENVAEIENINRQIVGSGEEYIENYDLSKFENIESDNLTINSSKFRELIQVKLDWPGRTLWAWSNKGVSGYDLGTGESIFYEQNAQGPLSLNAAKRLISYVKNGEIILHSIDGKVENLKISADKNIDTFPNKFICTFSPDGRVFVYNKNGKIYVYDLDNMSTLELKLSNIHIDGINSSGWREYYEPYTYTNKGSKLLLMVTNNALDSRYRTRSIAVIPYDSPFNAYLINTPAPVYTMTVDKNDDYLYFDHGYTSGIYGYKMDGLLNSNNMDNPKIIETGKESSYSTTRLYYYDNGFIRINKSSFPYLDASKKGSRMKPNYGYPDFDFKNGVYASGHDEGYVVIRWINFK